MSISRLTREKLYKDEELFNSLLPYVKWDEQRGVFVHSDASLWSIWVADPMWLTSTSDSDAFNSCTTLQEIFDSLDSNISVQFNWITSFDIDDILSRCMNDYPDSGVAGWMARRWTRMLKFSSSSDNFNRRVKKLRLVICFRFDPPWSGFSALDQLKDSFSLLLKGQKHEAENTRRGEEYQKFVDEFRGQVDGKINSFNMMGLRPSLVDGQGLIDMLYPILNRRSTKGGRFRRGRSNMLPVPEYDSDDLLSNQLSTTPAFHNEDGFIEKDGRIFHTVSMVKPPKQCLPMMTIPLQSSPVESIFSVTYSKDTVENQMKRLNGLDRSLGMRERGPLGRSNQQINHQISTVRQARDELYSNRSQIVQVGLHHVQVTQNIDEARRAASEVLAQFPTLNGARGMSHMISDLGVLLNALPGGYDPSTDGAGWTTMMRSSRASRLFPMWGNWKGSKNNLFVLPSLWNREVTSFDLYDSNVAPNVIISGVSGAGKSYLLNFIIITLMRGHYSLQPDGSKVERPPITFIFDKGMPNQPCGFEKVAKLFNGKIYQATPSRAPAMNFLARLGEMEGDQTSGDYKDIFDVCVDVIVDMATEEGTTLNRLQRNEIVESLKEAHYRFRHGSKEREFLLRDVVKVLKEPPRPHETEDNFRMRQELAIIMREFYGDGTYARFFDRAGSIELKERFIVFDLKGLSRSPDLQRVFLKVAMLWADEVMNDPKELDTRKMLVFDEAHDLVGKTSAGVVEAAFRLYRKRKGIVIAASQSGEDFYVGEGGQAIVQNSSHKVFLKQDPSKFHLTAQAFHLNPQQADTIMRLTTIKGVESQFFLLSDIGEAAMVLPLEPAFYWVSTNNGDDNQMFAALLDQADGDFVAALQRAVEIAPFGAGALAAMKREQDAAEKNEGKKQKRELDLSDGLSSS